MRLPPHLWLLCLSFVNFSSATQTNEVYNEELTLRPLSDGKLSARFAFKTLLKDVAPRVPHSLGTDDTSQHYTLFPLALGQILREYAITELHLTLNAGKWDYDRWGYPDESSVGSGAELWAWMGDGAPSSIDERWQGMQNALAGLFCASLNGMDNQRTTSPTRAFPPSGDLPLLPSPHTHALRHATLAAEHVCTENLTPFLKLLPCPGRAGIAALLAPHKIFDTNWHGLGVHVRWKAGEGVELVLAVQAVFDPVRSSGDDKRDWGFRSIFDRTIPRACPVANSSEIHVELPSNIGPGFSLTPEPLSVTDKIATYDVTSDIQELDVVMKWPEEGAFTYPLDFSSLTDFSVQRTLKGTSQSHGKISLVIRNNRASEIQVLYLETMPWHVEFYLHTLRLECHYPETIPCDHLLSNLTYTPPVPHDRPALLQTILTLPPLTTVHLHANIRKSFLRYTEHPPDAQRGWDLPPAVFVPLTSVDGPSSSINTSEGSHPQAHGRSSRARSWDGVRRLYTPVLLVELATPDFSMPYNVIIMSCTLIALIFGSFFNLLTRKFVVVKIPAASAKEKEEDKKEEAVMAAANLVEEREVEKGDEAEK